MKEQIKSILIENFQKTGQLSLSSQDSYQLKEEADQRGIGETVLARYHEEALKEAEEEIRFMMLKSPPPPSESPYFGNPPQADDKRATTPDKADSPAASSVAEVQENNARNKNDKEHNNYKHLKLIFSAMLLLLTVLAAILWQWGGKKNEPAPQPELRPVLNIIVPENDLQGEFRGIITVNRNKFPLRVVFDNVISKAEYEFELAYKIIYYNSKRETIEGRALYDSRRQTIEWGNSMLGISKVKKSEHLKLVKLSIESARFSAERDIITN
jgi:hypothetical protein